MSSRTLIPVEEYLATSYRPDCDYVDGEVLERNMGEWDHGTLQLKVGAYFLARSKEWGIQASCEQRVQVKPGRFRIPDVCVVLGDPGEQILTKPPFLCIEILSPEDRMARVQERIRDFLDMGVAYVWVLDPQTRQAFCATAAAGFQEVKSGVLRTESPTLEVPLDELFA